MKFIEIITENFVGSYQLGYAFLMYYLVKDKWFVSSEREKKIVEDTWMLSEVVRKAIRKKNTFIQFRNFRQNSFLWSSFFLLFCSLRIIYKSKLTDLT